jgi:type III secretion system low calcium response chaperone LcrH/SycD
VKMSDALSEAEAEEFYTFAHAQYESGSLKMARDAFNVLCIRKPLEHRFWFGYAATLQEEKKFEQALSAWAMAALLDCKNPYPHYHAAECSLSMNNLKDAKLALKETNKRIEVGHPLYDRIPLLKEAWKL